MKGREDSFGRRIVPLLFVATLATPVPAQAFDFSSLDIFGLFTEKPPEPSREALPYTIEFDVGDASGDAKQALQDASTTYRLRQDPPADGGTLVRRAQADLDPMLDALWGAGYYDASVRLLVADVPVSDRGGENAARAAESYRARERVPVRVVVDAGQRFTIRSVTVHDARTARPFAPDLLPPRVVKLGEGDAARASDIRATEAAVIDHFRGQSYPLVKATRIQPTVYHRDGVVDVLYTVNPGPKAPIGTVTVTGKSDVDPAVVRSFIYIRHGDPYSPKVLDDTRKSVLQLPAISSIRIREGEELDPDGTLPLTAEITDRKPRVVGFSARYGTLDGPAVHGYWQHRNLFGGAESLRLEGDVFVPPRTNASLAETIRRFRKEDLGGRFKASFVKPALQGTRNDLLVDAMVERDRTGGDRFGGYDARRFEATAAIRHRFSRTFSVQAGLAAEIGRTQDSLGVVDYRLFGIPLGLTYDSTDRPLDPTEGFRVTATATPYPSFMGSTVGLFETKIRASTYYALDEDARIVLAGRLGFGSVQGAALDLIPATHRFYAGGGGSVRGFRYRSLSPLGPTGEVIGGRSLLEGSLEARIKITDTIGIVPFIDAGGAFDSAYPDFKENIRYAVGLGLRYYTGIGPIRLDVAVPMNKRPGDQSVGVYIGIGQAF